MKKIEQQEPLNLRAYMALALPFMLSTVTQPLLGAVDTAVIGRLDHPAYIGGVAIGAVIFNTIYWLFGFLRVSTSGFAAQSLGTEKEADQYHSFLRPLGLALSISFLLILCKHMILNISMWIYKPDPLVIVHVQTYFSILIWGAPFVLMGYVNLGWLMGRKHVKSVLFLQISSNLINIVLDILFVVYLQKGIVGVAIATLIAQSYRMVLGTIFMFRYLSWNRMMHYSKDLLNSSEFRKILGVNSNLMIRTVCLLVMTNLFVAKGSELGTTVLAANAILYQIQYVISYLFDGLANASSIFSGKSVGEGNLDAFYKLLHISDRVVWGMALCIGLSLWGLKPGLLALFTPMEEVLSMCDTYYPWLILFPFVIGIGMVYYGLYTGATYTAPVRDSMLLSLGIFIMVYYTFIPRWGNHGLWLAFILFSSTRSLTLYAFRKKLIVQKFRWNKAIASLDQMT